MPGCNAIAASLRNEAVTPMRWVSSGQGQPQRKRKADAAMDLSLSSPIQPKPQAVTGEREGG